MPILHHRSRRPRAKRQDNHPRRLRPKGFRTLHLAGEQEWLYRVNGSGVAVHSPEGKRTFIWMTDITGWSWSDLERAEYKGYLPPITPSVVKDYIERNLCPKTG